LWWGRKGALEGEGGWGVLGVWAKKVWLGWRGVVASRAHASLGQHWVSGDISE